MNVPRENRLLVDATQLHLHVARPVRVECPHTGVEVTLVVDEELVAPLLTNRCLVQTQSTQPLAGGFAVTRALRAHLEDLPTGVHGSGEFFQTRVETAREDHVGREREVLQVLASAGHAVTQNGLESETRTGLDPVCDLREVRAVQLDGHPLAGLFWRAEVVDHLDRNQAVVKLFGLVVLVVADDGLDARQVLLRDPLALCRRKRDAMRALESTFTNQVLEVRSPTTTDVENQAVRLCFGVVRQDLALLDLGLFQTLVARQVTRGRVVHVLVQPEIEKLVGDVVRNFDVGLGAGHGFPGFRHHDTHLRPRPAVQERLTWPIGQWNPSFVQAIPEELVAQVVSDISARMADPQFAQVAVGRFVQAQPAISQFLSARASAFGGEAVIHAAFHSDIVSECFRRQLGREVLPEVGFPDLDRVAGEASLTKLADEQPAIADYLTSNVEGEPLREVIALVARALASVV